MNPLNWWRGWRLPLRIAWRDARRARGRSVLVLVMIALPVLAVTAADTLYATQGISGGEAIERRLGAAEARLELSGAGEVQQAFDPDRTWFGTGASRDEGLGLAGALAVLGGDRPVLETRTGEVRHESDGGFGRVSVTEVDLRDPLGAGLAELATGRWAADAGEAVVSHEVLDRGPVLGGDLVLASGRVLEIVGVAESTSITGYPLAWGLPGAFDVDGASTYLVGGEPVSWSQVRELNEGGVVVLSRQVVSDPPPTSALADDVRWSSGGVDSATMTVLVLVVVMVLIEVVLLAGPAFAVGARRQARTLALVAAAGGSPRDARRVVLGSGVVLGLLGSALGVLLGLVAAVAIEPLLQRFSAGRFGPFDVAWTHLAGVAAFGLVSALLAAAVPAWIASRQDVVAVLAGRRGDAAASRRSPVVGLLLVGAGVAGAVLGARRSSGGEIYIASSAILSVLGMVLLVPVVVTLVARAARFLPLPLRFAARDAARHRTRTVPAVAAVAATVAGVVALGIAITSDEAENAQTYTASLASGDASINDYSRRPDWAAIEEAAGRVVGAERVEQLRGVPENGNTWVDIRFRAPEGGRLLDGWGGTLASSVLVADELPPLLLGLDDSERGRAVSALGQAGVVVFASRPVAADEVRVSVKVNGPRDVRGPRRSAALPAAYVTAEEQQYPALQAVLSPAAAERLGIEAQRVGLMIDGPVSTSEGEDLEEAVAQAARDAYVYVERGYQAPDETVIIQLVLAGLGAVLMLGGTLTATFLALSDARPDLATLSAVGAAPRTRRGVAAAYALVVGLVGAVLGALVGAVPGVAVTYPLTVQSGGTCELEGSGSCTASGLGSGPYLDVPWLLVLGVVVGLPLLTSAVVGLTARSRLPLVARLD